MITVSIIGILFSSIFLLDSLLPAKRVSTQVLDTVSYGRRSGKYGTSPQYGFITAIGKIVVPASLFRKVERGDYFEYDETQLFGIANRFYHDNYEYIILNIYFFHRIPLVLLLALSISCGVLRKKDSAATYFSAALSIMLLVFLLYMLMDSTYLADS